LDSVFTLLSQLFRPFLLSVDGSHTPEKRGGQAVGYQLFQCSSSTELVRKQKFKQANYMISI